MKFRRSTIGYDPLLVEKKLNSMEQDFHKNISNLEAQIRELEERNNLLKSNINELKSEVAKQKSSFEEISDLLLVSHLEATEKIHQTIMDVQNMEKDKIEVINSCEKRNQKLRETLKRIMIEMQYMIDE